MGKAESPMGPLVVLPRACRSEKQRKPPLAPLSPALRISKQFLRLENTLG